MVGQQRVWSTRRVSVADALIVAMIAAAVAVTISLYQAAIADAEQARTATVDSQRAQQLVSISAQQLVEMFRYLTTEDQAYLVGAQALDRQFDQVVGAVTTGSAASARALANVSAAQDHYYSAFLADRRLATASLSRKLTAIGQLDLEADNVTGALNTLAGLATDRAAGSAAAASSAAGQALAIGVAAATLAVLTGAGFAWFMIGLLRRAHQRELELTEALGRLTEALGRLGDRDELLARLRSASAVLGEVAAELRTAARNAAAVTSEQSAAVAQTSATIQQLAATAGSIADTVRAVSQAADRAGDTMRDLQEKVEAISDRALSLGGRTQK